jgi:small-conductance mechanosensitive channel
MTESNGGNMSDAHEHMEHAEHAEHAAGFNKKIALLIAVLALFLSFSETLGKSAQTEAIDANVKSSDLWAFFQAKTIRRTTLLTAAAQLKLQGATVTDPQAKAAMEKQIAEWEKTAATFDSDPKSREGRRELTERARATEEIRDLAMAKYHHYELASAAFQVGIVLASATVITGIIALAWFAGALGVVGLALLALGLFAPHVMEAIL